MEPCVTEVYHDTLNKHIHNHWKPLIEKEIISQRHAIVNFELKIPLCHAQHLKCLKTPHEATDRVYTR